MVTCFNHSAGVALFHFFFSSYEIYKCVNSFTPRRMCQFHGCFFFSVPFSLFSILRLFEFWSNTKMYGFLVSWKFCCLSSCAHYWTTKQVIVVREKRNNKKKSEGNGQTVTIFIFSTSRIDFALEKWPNETF